MKERSTVILPVRIEKSLLEEVERKVASSKQKSRNAWVLWAIKSGLRKHNNSKGKEPFMNVVKRAIKNQVKKDGDQPS